MVQVNLSSDKLFLLKRKNTPVLSTPAISQILAHQRKRLFKLNDFRQRFGKHGWQINQYAMSVRERDRAPMLKNNVTILTYRFTYRTALVVSTGRLRYPISEKTMQQCAAQSANPTFRWKKSSSVTENASLLNLDDVFNKSAHQHVTQIDIALSCRFMYFHLYVVKIWTPAAESWAPLSPNGYYAHRIANRCVKQERTKRNF